MTKALFVQAAEPRTIRPSTANASKQRCSAFPWWRAAGAREKRHVSHVRDAASGVLSVPLVGFMPDNGCSDSVATQ